MHTADKSMSQKYKVSASLCGAGALGRLPFIEMESLDDRMSVSYFPGVEGAYESGCRQKMYRT